MTTDLDTFRASARIAERLLVELREPGNEHCGRLADFAKEAIERQLAAHGAAPPSIGAHADFEATLEDQLYRVRLLGATGLALCFGSLQRLADAQRNLGLDDSATLRAWFAAAALKPVQLYFPESTTTLGVFEAPRALASWLPQQGRPLRWAAIEFDADATGEDHTPTPRAPKVADFATGRALQATPAPQDDVEPQEASEIELPAASEIQPLAVSEPETAAAAAPEAAAANEVMPATASEGTSASASEAPLANSVEGEPASVRASAPARLERAAAPRAEAKPPVTPEPPAAASIIDSALQRAAAARCQAWMQQLREMAGPKNHASIERIFLQAYVPLSRELHAGMAPEGAERIVTEWAEGFAQSYSAAFKRLQGRRPRPRMVSDVIEIALRWSTQYRSRGCQVLLVDGMRFDLGTAVNEQLALRLGRAARCVDQALLWSALPSNTGAQLQLLAQTHGLRPLPQDKLGARWAFESAPAKSAIERIELGSRPIFRLDSVEADLRKPGEGHIARVERLAGEVASRIAPWIQSQAAGSLIVLFGDHGFHWDATSHGTTAAQCGGALPEQVLVPASAWVVSEARGAETLH